MIAGQKSDSTFFEKAAGVAAAVNDALFNNKKPHGITDANGKIINCTELKKIAMKSASAQRIGTLACDVVGTLSSFQMELSPAQETAQPTNSSDTSDPNAVNVDYISAFEELGRLAKFGLEAYQKETDGDIIAKGLAAINEAHANATVECKTLAKIKVAASVGWFLHFMANLGSNAISHPFCIATIVFGFSMFTGLYGTLLSLFRGTTPLDLPFAVASGLSCLLASATYDVLGGVASMIKPTLGAVQHNNESKKKPVFFSLFRSFCVTASTAALGFCCGLILAKVSGPLSHESVVLLRVDPFAIQIPIHSLLYRRPAALKSCLRLRSSWHLSEQQVGCIVSLFIKQFPFFVADVGL